jgi:hypothetical protein
MLVAQINNVTATQRLDTQRTNMTARKIRLINVNFSCPLDALQLTLPMVTRFL